MQAINDLLKALQLEANVFHNGQYCGLWAIDTSGTRQMTFHVVTHGHCELHIGGQWVTMQEGDAVFFPRDSRHRMTNIRSDSVPLNSEQPISMQTLEADGTGLVCGYFCHNHPIFHNMVKQMPEYILVNSEISHSATTVIDLILQESKISGQSTNFLLNRLADSLFYLILRDTKIAGQGLFGALVHPQIGKALELIHIETSERISVDELAKEVGMSRSAFADLFKKLVGQSPAEYRTQWSMTNAWRWLADDGISTLEAALKCGYESEASFSKAFKKIMGVGPGQARR